VPHRAIDTYLIDQLVPAAGAACQPDSQPFEAGDQP
jgi:hypothetical protein